MACSHNSSTFTPNWPWTFENGTVVYCDTPCVASFAADADIAGPGVIIGFVTTAWYTIFIAMIPAFYETREWYRGNRPSLSTKQWNSRPISRLEANSKTLLNHLCDLQAITGMAIVIAGLVLMPEISYYHEQFVNDYWNLTLSSFWAARADYIRDSGWHLRSLPSLVRRVAVLASCVLAVSFKGLTILRETRHWDYFEDGRCYLSHDYSGEAGEWFRIIGISTYTVVLCLSFTPWTTSWILSFYSCLGDIYEWFKSSRNKSYGRLRQFKASKSPEASWISSFPELIWRLVALSFLTSAAAFMWFLIQFLMLWFYGEGFYAFEILCYIGLAAWNTFDIVDLKLSNVDLVEGSEFKWGFGQVLATSLLGIIVFHTIDSFTRM